MDSRKFVLLETGIVALGQAICAGIMIGIFALLGKFDRSIWLGGIAGSLLAVANFFFMAIATNSAADRAQNQDIKAGKATIKLSYTTRLLVMGVLLFVLAKTGHCNALALVAPLLFVFPIIMVIEFFRKAGESKK